MFLAKLFRKKEVSPFTNAEFFHKDNNGLKWYEFNDKLIIPVLRYVKLQKFVIIWNRNLDNVQLNELIDEANTCFEDGLMKKKDGKSANLIKVASILNEIKNRQTMIRPFEVMADLLAIQFIRSDENYYEFDKTIHLEKKQYIMDMAKKKEPFFLGTTVYNKLTNSHLTSIENFQEYLEQSEAAKEIHKKAIEYFNSLK